MVEELFLVINWIGYVICILTLQTTAFICIRSGQKKLITLLKISYVLIIGGA